MVVGAPFGSNELDTGISAVLNSGSLVLDRVAVTAEPSFFLSQTVEGISIGVVPGVPVDLKDVVVSQATRGIDIDNVTPNATTAVSAVLQNVSISASQIGLAVVNTSVIVRNSSFRDAGVGFSSIATTAVPVSILDSTQITNNATGISFGGAGTMRLFNNVLSGNTTGINAGGTATVISFRNNAFAGNGTDGSPLLSTSLK